MAENIQLVLKENMSTWKFVFIARHPWPFPPLSLRRHFVCKEKWLPQTHLKLKSIRTLRTLLPKLPGVLLKSPKTLVTGETLQQLPRIWLAQLRLVLFLHRPGQAGINNPPVLIVKENPPHLPTGTRKPTFKCKPAGTNLVPLLLLQDTPSLTPSTPRLTFTPYL